jgi:hypothetical protein
MSMKNRKVPFLLLALAFWASAARAQSPDNYYSALKDHFKVSDKAVTDTQAGNISDEELPVVFFIAQRANVEPVAVTSARSSGLTWMQTAFYFHLSPWAFYTPLPSKAELKTPFEKAYGQYRARKPRIDLTDPEVVHLVGLKFLSEYYGRDPLEVVQLRAAGKGYVEINDAYWAKKEEVGWDVPVPAAASTPTAQTTPTRRHRHRGGGGMGGQAPSPGTSQTSQ